MFSSSSQRDVSINEITSKNEDETSLGKRRQKRNQVGEGKRCNVKIKGKKCHIPMFAKCDSRASRRQLAYSRCIFARSSRGYSIAITLGCVYTRGRRMKEVEERVETEQTRTVPGGAKKKNGAALRPETTSLTRATTD